MKKILIVTEGQTEQILIKNVLQNIFLQDKFSFRCIKLNADTLGHIYEHKCRNPIVHFELINVQNDDLVLSYILKNEQRYFENDYNRIIGLRDMYCKRYKILSNNRYDENLNIELEDIAKKSISELENHLKIVIYFAVMEIEAWFLAMYKIFERVNIILKPEHILEQIDFDIINNNPEKVFRPTKIISKIYNLANKKYDKSKGCAEGITSNITYEDINLGVEDGRCNHFEYFINEIMSYDIPLINN